MIKLVTLKLSCIFKQHSQRSYKAKKHLTAILTHSLCPLMTLMAWMDGPLKSHILKLVSSEEVSTRRWVGWVQQCVSFRS